MGISALERKIISEAEEEIKKIEADARKEIEEVNKRFKEESREEEKRILSEAERKAELARKEVVGGARISARVRVLECKKRLLDEFFLEVEKRVLGMPDAGKKKVLATLLGDAEVLDGEVLVYVPDEYRKLVPKKYKTKAGDFTDFGVVIESSDGLKRIDKRLKPVLGDLRGKLTHELNKIFWG